MLALWLSLSLEQRESKTGEAHPVAMVLVCTATPAVLDCTAMHHAATRLLTSRSVPQFLHVALLSAVSQPMVASKRVQCLSMAVLEYGCRGY